ncbi:hypothetical protein F4779DRAFT_623396 [Xylariaceae sp. FL0662B]|nr:hypothetical protein F4779DRAFT_623396 [Xylariaceae sp. FL0662B]
MSDALFDERRADRNLRGGSVNFGDICIICSDEKSVLDFPYPVLAVGCCNLVDICADCLRESIRQQVLSRNREIQCPQCDSELDFDTIRFLLDDDTIDKHERFLLYDALEKDPTFVWCSHGCGSGQLHPTGHDAPILTCVNCRRSTCVIHRTAWHFGQTCEQVDQQDISLANGVEQMELQGTGETERIYDIDAMKKRTTKYERKRERDRKSAAERLREAEKMIAEFQRRRDDMASRALIKQVSKPCPRCEQHIEKSGGW